MVMVSTEEVRLALSHHLGSACQEVQDPVGKGGFKPQDPELENKLSGHSKAIIMLSCNLQIAFFFVYLYSSVQIN